MNIYFRKRQIFQHLVSSLKDGIQQNKIVVVKTEKKPKSKKRLIYKNLDDIKDKCNQIEETIKLLQGPENKRKRKRLYHELVILKKSLDSPDQYLIDPKLKQKKLDEDKERRIQKKIQKKQERVKESKLVKKRHQHDICLSCKQVGHIATNCREIKLQSTQTQCYICGSFDHKLQDCPNKQFGNQDKLKFAQCFVCKETGHISKDCPKNEHGLYPKGGGCYICGGINHLKIDCPKNPVNQIRNHQKNSQTAQYFSEEEED